MGDKLITIEVDIRIDREKSIGIATGETEMYQGRERDKLVFLPKSMVEIHDDNTITLPVWKAREAGLI